MITRGPILKAKRGIQEELGKERSKIREQGKHNDPIETEVLYEVRKQRARLSERTQRGNH